MIGLLLTVMVLVPSGQAYGMTFRLARDTWWGKDKVQHLAASFGAQSLAYSCLRARFSRGKARIMAWGIALALGILKEVWDTKRTGFSFRDLFYDFIGASSATAFP